MINRYKFCPSLVTSALAWDALRLAQIEAERTSSAMKSRAKICSQDAYAAFNLEDEVRAYVLAIESLEYSIGVFHPTYQALRKAAY